MAKETDDGKWKDNRGNVHDSKVSAEGANHVAAQSRGPVSDGASGAMVGMMPKIFIGIGIVIFGFFIIQMIRNIITLAGVLWHLTIPIGLALAAAITIWILLRRQPWIIRLIPCLLAGGLIGFFGTKPVLSYYNTGNFYLPAEYSADYILAGRDGKAPAIYEKGQGQGEILYQPEVDERVTVNGIRFNSSEFNITTAGGITGWITNEAFPKYGRDWQYTMAELDGSVYEPFFKDRIVERLAEKYMEKEKNYMTVGTFAMSERTLRNSYRVNAETPLFHISENEFRKTKRKETAELQDTGVTVRLNNIIYHPDCTIIYLSCSYNFDVLNVSSGIALFGQVNSNEWKKSLVVTDLDTGESWQVLQTDYHYTTNGDYIYKEPGNVRSDSVGWETSTAFFFPPFKSRNFSLTRNEVSPLPRKGVLGFSGPLGFLGSIFAGGSEDHFIDWNFPQVRVR